MKLSIITVCFNAELTINNTIESILSQTSDDFEWIVVDGESTDNTNDIIAFYLPKFRERGIPVNYISEKDRGIYDAMNKGAFMASGEFLTYMNADDLYYDDKIIEKILNILDETSADVLYGDTCFVKSNRRHIEKSKEIGTITYHLPFCPQSVFIKSELQRQLQFDINFEISSDYDFFLRAYMQKKHFLKVNEVVSVFNFGGASNKDLIKTYEDDVAVKVKNGLEKKNSLIRKMKRIVFRLKLRRKSNEDFSCCHNI